MSDDINGHLPSGLAFLAFILVVIVVFSAGVATGFMWGLAQ